MLCFNGRKIIFVITVWNSFIIVLWWHFCKLLYEICVRYTLSVGYVAILSHLILRLQLEWLFCVTVSKYFLEHYVCYDIKSFNLCCFHCVQFPAFLLIFLIFPCKLLEKCWLFSMLDNILYVFNFPDLLITSEYYVSTLCDNMCRCFENVSSCNQAFLCRCFSSECVWWRFESCTYGYSHAVSK